MVGSTFGAYEVLARLGAGGMGEVYRARDIKLNRDVAIKVLLPAFARDADRLARFQREAQVLASLNHPNVAHIHGLEERDGVRALVMEFVDGKTLAELLEARRPPIDDMLAMARQILDGLQAAHDQGIIHRDLKPANVKVRPDGTVKVLDFGLAKLADPVRSSDHAGATMTESPTITSPAMTAAGFIVGTAAYMSPEQAKGRDVDKRADMWAFGCLLYEMLTGVRAFVADDVSDTLARVLLKDPEWSALPEETPPAVRRLLKRCLERDPRRRLDSASAARLDIDEALAEYEQRAGVAPGLQGVQAPQGGRAVRAGQGLPWAVAAMTTLAAIAVLVLWAPWRSAAETPRQIFQVGVEAEANNAQQVTISRDGIALAGRGVSATEPGLWIRPLNQLTSSQLRGTLGASYPFFSADGSRIAFYADGKLKVIDATGGAVQTLAETAGGFGGDWNRAGTILFVQNANSPIYRLDAPGATPVSVTAIDAGTRITGHRFPQFLPDGTHFIYLAASANAEASGIYVGSLNSRETTRLLSSTTKAVFAPPDLLLYLRESTTLVAQHLNMKTFTLTGTPVVIADSVASNLQGGAAFAVSDTGVLTYVSGGIVGGARQLAWLDRGGKSHGVLGAPARYENPRFSPDKKRLAVSTNGDIWIVDVEANTRSRFTFGPATANGPLWSPDGSRIAFVSDRDGGVFNIYIKGLTGNDELLLKTVNNKMLNDWSADGQYLLYQEDNPKTKNDLWLLPMTGNRTPQPLLVTPFNEQNAALSPDGRFFVYESDEGATGASARQVYAQHLPPDGSKWQVSNGSLGATPRWRGDGKEIYYDAGGPFMAVAVLPPLRPGEFRLGVPQHLFNGLGPLPPHNFDFVDNDRFLVLLAPQTPLAGSAPITVVLNWTSELNRH